MEIELQKNLIHECIKRYFILVKFIEVNLSYLNTFLTEQEIGINVHTLVLGEYKVLDIQYVFV